MVLCGISVDSVDCKIMDTSILLDLVDCRSHLFSNSLAHSLAVCTISCAKIEKILCDTTLDSIIISYTRYQDMPHALNIYLSIT
jgi:hypothetical protein